jgi:hypothetical protein
VIAGVVVLLGAALAWLFSTLAITETTHPPAAVIVPLTLAFGVLIGAIARAIASGPTRGWPGIVGRAAVGISVGAVVVVLAGRRCSAALRYVRGGHAAPTPHPPSRRLAESPHAHSRTALDAAVDDASRRGSSSCHRAL